VLWQGIEGPDSWPNRLFVSPPIRRMGGDAPQTGARGATPPFGRRRHYSGRFFRKLSIFAGGALLRSGAKFLKTIPADIDTSQDFRRILDSTRSPLTSFREPATKRKRIKFSINGRAQMYEQSEAGRRSLIGFLARKWVVARARHPMHANLRRTGAAGLSSALPTRTAPSARTRYNERWSVDHRGGAGLRYPEDYRREGTWKSGQDIERKNSDSIRSPMTQFAPKPVNEGGAPA